MTGMTNSPPAAATNSNHLWEKNEISLHKMFHQ